MRPTNIPMVNHQWSQTGRDQVPQALPAGDCIPMIAGATLNIGELVYVSAANTVNKSAVAATVAAAPLGVVIGGALTNGHYPEGYIPTVAPAYPAANVNQSVVIQYDGLALVYCTGALAAGATVSPGAVAGQVVAGAVAGQIVGFNVGAALAGAGWALIKLEHR